MIEGLLGQTQITYIIYNMDSSSKKLLIKTSAWPETLSSLLIYAVALL